VDAALDSAPADDGGEAQLAKDQFLTAYTNARCSYLAGCGLFTSLDACVASTSPSQYNLGYRYMLAAVDRGVATYVPSAAAACVAGIAQQPCAGTAPTSNAACGQIFVGTIPTGGTCLQSGECAPAGSEPPACVPTTSGACAAGTCAMVQVAAAGGSCAATPGVLKHCPDGQYCQSSTWTCTPLAAQGQVCVFQGAVATCQSGMFCAYDQTASGYRCIQRAPTGGACPLNDITGAPNCANLSDYCATGMGTAGMKTCAPRLSVGSSCVAGAGSCVRTAYCDGSVCRAQAGPGEVCTTAASQPGEKQCAGDLTCVQPGTTGDGGVSTPTCVLPSSGDICPPPA
jgi:hypothetical protein